MPRKSGGNLTWWSFEQVFKQSECLNKCLFLDINRPFFLLTKKWQTPVCQLFILPNKNILSFLILKYLIGFIKWFMNWAASYLANREEFPGKIFKMSNIIIILFFEILITVISRGAICYLTITSNSSSYCKNVHQVLSQRRNFNQWNSSLLPPG